MTRALTAIEIVPIGDELLSGATIDTNAALIARRLETLGLRVTRRTTVGDSADDIADAVRSALARTRAVITTGGLGPTNDDLTKRAVARVFDCPLEFRDDLWHDLQQRWARRGPIPETNRTQAEIPRGAELFPNRRGTAPGLALEDKSLGLCVLLPGPPHELDAMLAESVVPFLTRRVSPVAKRPFRRLLRTAGIAESAIAERIAGRLDDLALDVAYLPEVDGNDIRLTVWAVRGAEAAAILDEGVTRLRALLGRHVYAEDPADLAEVVGDLLRQRGMTLAVAESCTGGLIAKRITDFPGASDYFWGGVVAYADRAKAQLLGVAEETLRTHGAVSEQTAREMAEGAQRNLGVDAAIAVTGVAGPSGGSEDKPVGTVWLAARVRERTVTKRRHYPGARDMVRMRAAQGALDLLRRTLLEDGE